MHGDHFTHHHPRVERVPVGASQLLDLRDAALQRDRTLRDTWSRHDRTGNWSQPRKNELVHLGTGFDTCLIELFCKVARRQVADEFARGFGITHAVFLAYA
jgi:hypothetical protein